MLNILTTTQLLSEINLLEREAIERPQFKIGIIRNYTIEGLIPHLRLQGLRMNVDIQTCLGGYEYMAEFMTPSSPIRTADSSLILIDLLPEKLDQDYGRVCWTANQSIKKLEQILDLSVKDSSAVLAVCTFIPMLAQPNGITNMTNYPSHADEIGKINHFIRKYAKSHPHRIIVIEKEALAIRLGADRTFDTRFWYTSQAPYKNPFFQLYAEEIAKIIRAITGKNKKCLVLDCDNTIWGGIVGEDGIGGIDLDINAYPGRAFYDFQTIILNLRERGVILALCSKNNQEDVFQVLDSHPYCQLKRIHFAAIAVNWKNKAENIQDLAKQLNIGLNSIVFIDDSAIECDLVSANVPEVTVLQAPKEPHKLLNFMEASALFGTLSTTNEDLARTELYQSEIRRSAEKDSFIDLESYLQSLEINAVIHMATAKELPRVAQLLQKTNQFNLTNRRHRLEQIENFISDENTAIFTLTVNDKFGDMGLTGVLIGINHESEIRVDTLLLSCRILGRQLETVFVTNCINEMARKWHKKSIVAEYIASTKNQQAEFFWDSQGFDLQETKNSIQLHKVYKLDWESNKLKLIPYIKVTN